MAGFPRRLERPYTKAVAFVEADALARRLTGEPLPVKKSLRWFYRRVAALDAPYGRRLDDLGANMRQIRWVASPGMTGTERARQGRDGRNVEVEARYQALVAFLEGRTAHATFDAMVAAFEPHGGEAEIPPLRSITT